MDYNAAALEMHAKYPGKLIVNSLFEVKDRDALSTAYTPGVAEPCRQIKANPDDVYKYTFKGRTVAVVTNGTAVLGLGNIGPEAGLPVMEGKCVLFKEFGGVDAFPICLNASTREEVIAAVKAIAPTFGGINLEDIRSPECFDIEAELERDLDIPVFHDDQHGTAIIVLAGVLNALKVVGKRLEDVKIVQNGPGAAGTAIIKMLQVAGAKNIVAVDEHGILYPGRPAGLADHKEWLPPWHRMPLCSPWPTPTRRSCPMPPRQPVCGSSAPAAAISPTRSTMFWRSPASSRAHFPSAHGTSTPR